MWGYGGGVIAGLIYWHHCRYSPRCEQNVLCLQALAISPLLHCRHVFLLWKVCLDPIGEIRECNGVYANAKTLEECREELREVLGEWVLFRVSQEPPIAGDRRD